MIRKRIEIFSITVLVIIATTGMPLSYHFCEMTGSKSLESCNICSETMDKNDEDSCCMNENTDDSSTKFVSDQSCCQTEFVLNKVNDEYVLNKTEVIHLHYTIVLHPIFVEKINSQEFVNKNKFYYDTSPPFLIDPDLHITNSVLLI